jgi:hypothetical protein
MPLRQSAHLWQEVEATAQKTRVRVSAHVRALDNLPEAVKVELPLE